MDALHFLSLATNNRRVHGRYSRKGRCYRQLKASKTAARSGKAAGATRTASSFSRDQELKAYREMLLIRRFEEKAGQMYGMGLIGGFCHLYIGQEAVVVGMQMAST